MECVISYLNFDSQLTRSWFRNFLYRIRGNIPLLPQSPTRSVKYWAWHCRKKYAQLLTKLNFTQYDEISFKSTWANVWLGFDSHIVVMPCLKFIGPAVQFPFNIERNMFVYNDIWIFDQIPNCEIHWIFSIVDFWIESVVLSFL